MRCPNPKCTQAWTTDFTDQDLEALGKAIRQHQEQTAGATYQGEPGHFGPINLDSVIAALKTSTHARR